MSYFAPSVDSTGFHSPTYSDILNYLLTSYKNIYGQDVYLGNDASDYQWISVVADKIYDVLSALQLDYNNRSVLTAVGAALDGLIKSNGITRKTATYSTCVVTCTGIAGTVIINGVVQDLSGYYWDLSSSVTIGTLGTVDTTATCRTIGAISALPASITSIVSIQAGWTSVTNSVAAVLGQPVETDSQLRARQSLSTRLASHTMLAGTIAGIAAVANVTRYNVHENKTDFTDAQSCPPHSITSVVEGGTDDDVAAAIFFNRGIGCNTNGDVDVTVTDPDTGDDIIISFMRPNYIPIYVDVDITKFTGYTDSITTAIETAIYTYLNELQIGQDLTISGLYAAAMAVMDDITNPLFSITSLKAGTSSITGTTDININFDEVVQGILGASPAYINVVAT